MSFDLSKVSRLYVIGDIHGRPDLLDRMAAAIKHDLGSHPSDGTLTVTLGDYVDRGPDSRGVIERLIQNPFSMPYVGLRGNHEHLFMSFLTDPSVGPAWRDLGGLETLHSYGVAVASLMMGKNFDNAAQALRQAVPESHVKFFSSLKDSMIIGDYFLCHAGVKPGVPLERQRPEDLLWIRETFLTSRKNFGKIVIHGHTPCEQPEVLSNRINIDTGAYATGRLTCLVAEPKGRRFLATA
jgi:serine/threonine protein phosphatase 1